ncbi:glycosyltransferase family 39 protein [candidate division WOR-3 bacterium]|nr:glycosyltransferase family 39 protein [candidate division WOR-3 bacterium]
MLDIFKNERRFLIFLFLFALAIRVVFISFPIIAQDALEVKHDAATHNMAAMRVVEGKEDTAPRTGYYLFLAIIYFLFGHNLYAARFAQAILGALTCLIIYFIGREVFSKKAGIIAGLISAMYPYFLYYTGMLLSETLAVFLLSLATLLIVKYIKSLSFPPAKSVAQASSLWAGKTALLVGVFLGLATIIKPIVFGFPVFLLIGMILLSRKKTKAVFHFLGILAIFFLTLSPWVIRNSLVTKKVCILPYAGLITSVATNPNYKYRFSEPEKLEEWQESHLEKDKIRAKKKGAIFLPLSYIRNNPKEFFSGLWFKFKEFWRPAPHRTGAHWSVRNFILGWLSAGLISILGLLGMIFSYRSWRLTLIPILLVVYFTVAYSLTIGLPRYRLPIMPIMILFASYGLYSILSQIPMSRILTHFTQVGK